MHLADLVDLNELVLRNTQVTDAGLEHLAKLSELVTLDLSQTQVTDAGLRHLAGLTELRSLQLTSTPVTHSGIKKLAKALPALPPHAKTPPGGPAILSPRAAPSI